MFYPISECCKPRITGIVGSIRNMSNCTKFAVFEHIKFCWEAMAGQRSGNAESHLVRKLGTRVPTLWGKNYSFLPMG